MVDIEIGRKAKEGLCSECQDILSQKIKLTDVTKGMRNMNHLLKIINESCCEECKKKIMVQGRNYAQGVRG